MKENIKIAVIVAAFNAEKYIKRCIQSIQRQTYSDWLAYIVDDGSNDNTVEVLAALKYVDERIIYVSTENNGVFHARRTAIDMVEDCKYLTFLDSDDYFSDERIFEKCIKKMETECIDCLNFNYEQYSGIPGFKGKEEVIWTEKKEIIKNLLCRKYIDGNMPYAMYNSETVKRYFKAYPYNNDDFLNKYDFLVNSKKVAYEPWCGYFYYINENSQTHRSIRENDYLYYEHVKDFVERIEKEYPEPRKECDYFRCWVLLWLTGQLKKDKKHKKYAMYKPIMKEFRMNKDIYRNNPYFSKKEKITVKLIRMCLYSMCYRIYHAIR